MWSPFVRSFGDNPVPSHTIPDAYEYEFVLSSLIFGRGAFGIRSGFVENRSGCLPSCLPPCMHVDTGALIVGRDAFGIRSRFVWDSFEIRSGCLPSCLPPCRSYGTVLHYM